MAKQSRAISNRPSKAEGGFGISDGVVGTLSLIYTRWSDAGEKAISGGREADDPALKVTVEPDEGGEPMIEHLSAGKGTRMVPSEDGQEESESGPFLVRAEGSSAAGLNKNCNAFYLLKSITKPVNGKLKFPENALDDGVDKADGMKVVFARVPAPKLPGLGQEGQEERTILTVGEILALPGKSGSKPKTKPEEGAGDAEDDDDPVGEAQSAIVQLLADDKYKKGISKDKLFAAVLGKVKASKNRSKIIKLIQSEEFLADGPWNYEDGTLTPATE